MALTANPFGGALPNNMEVEIRMTQINTLRCDKCPETVEWFDLNTRPAGWLHYDRNKDLCPECYKGYCTLTERHRQEHLKYLGIAQKGGE